MRSTSAAGTDGWNGRNALHVAADSGATWEVTEILVREQPGAVQERAVCWLGFTPLDLAASRDSIEVARCIVGMYPETRRQRNEKG
jgi:hypothetical protein